MVPLFSSCLISKLAWEAFSDTLYGFPYARLPTTISYTHHRTGSLYQLYQLYHLLRLYLL